MSSHAGNKDGPVGSGWERVSSVLSWVCALIERLALANLTHASNCFTFWSLMLGGRIVPWRWTEKAPIVLISSPVRIGYLKLTFEEFTTFTTSVNARMCMPCLFRI